MSNGNTAIPVSPVAQIMAELAAGEQARARVPELTAMIDQLSDKLNESQRHAQNLELNCQSYRGTISDLTDKVRALEVARDDASFRTLEAEDKLAILLKAMRATLSDMDATVMQIDPPKVPEPIQPVVQGQSEASPTQSAPSTGVTSENVSSNTAETLAVASAPSEAYRPFSPDHGGEGQATNEPYEAPPHDKSGQRYW